MLKKKACWVKIEELSKCSSILSIKRAKNNKFAHVSKLIESMSNFSNSFYPFPHPWRFYCVQSTLFKLDSSKVDEFKIEITRSESNGKSIEMGIIKEWNWTCEKDSLSMGWTKMADVGKNNPDLIEEGCKKGSKRYKRTVG